MNPLELDARMRRVGTPVSIGSPGLFANLRWEPGITAQEIIVQ
jgi:hypothetical protein